MTERQLKCMDYIQCLSYIEYQVQEQSFETPFRAFDKHGILQVTIVLDNEVCWPKSDQLDANVLLLCH